MSPYFLLFVVLYVGSTHTHASWDDPITNDDLKKHFSKQITFREIKDSIDLAQDNLNRMETHEHILRTVEVAIGSPTHEQFIENFPEPEAVEIMKTSLLAVSAARNVFYSYCSQEAKWNGKCREMMKYFSLQNTSASVLCEKLEKKCSPMEIQSNYRSYDGSCNNVHDGDRGQSFTVYRRVLPDNYDFICDIKFELASSAQVISTNLYINPRPDNDKSLAILYWGQFIEHDLSHTAMSQMYHTGQSIECCNTYGKITNPRNVHRFGLPISISTNDQYYSRKDITCLSYARSIPGIGPECTLGPRNQLNQATHYLDASQIYGTSLETARSLRTFKNGQLSVLRKENSNFLTHSKDQDCPPRRNLKECFKSGDKRVNGNPYITAMYTLWHREHNRIAAKLAEINTEWNDETVFQEARRIVIAEIQHITYSEWIPEVLGLEINDAYVPDGNSVVSNSFATAAMRALQSGGPDRLTKHKNEEIHKVERSKKIDELIKGLTTEQYHGRSLEHFGVIPGKFYGIDTLTFDIYRGRDHGLATYNAFREFCGLNKAANFKDLHSTMSPRTVETLQKNYKTVDDIDLIVGGIAEKPQKGVFGPTLTCILKEQLKRTRQADRFFYTNQNQPKPFSESQLKEIRKVTLARIICDNTKNLNKIQSNVFRRPGKQNSDKECKTVPSLNFNMWK